MLMDPNRKQEAELNIKDTEYLSEKLSTLAAIVVDNTSEG
jgi:hypothetical protein